MHAVLCLSLENVTRKATLPTLIAFSNFWSKNSCKEHAIRALSHDLFPTEIIFIFPIGDFVIFNAEQTATSTAVLVFSPWA